MVGKRVVIVAFAATVFAQPPVATIPKADRIFRNGGSSDKSRRHADW